MGSIEEIEYQENAVLETAIEINSPSETKSDRSPYNGKKIDKIIICNHLYIFPSLTLTLYLTHSHFIATHKNK